MLLRRDHLKASDATHRDANPNNGARIVWGAALAAVGLFPAAVVLSDIRPP